MLTLLDAKAIELRPYQTDAVEALRQKIRADQKRLILCAGTGAGKTVIASHLLREADRKDKYALFLVDRVALVNQTSATLDAYGIRHGVVQSGNPRYAPRENVQVCSIQTLERRRLPRDPDLIVYDECHCFVAGTLIGTPTGPRPIEDIKFGDEVLNALGVGRVLHTFKNPARELLKVSFDDGTEITCTPNHRFFTGDAWIQARFLDGQSAFSVEGMSELWRYLSAGTFSHSGGELVGGTRGVLEKASLLLEELCKEAQESDAQPSLALAYVRDFARNQTHAEDAGRERSRPDRATATTAARAWARLDTGARGGDWGASRKRRAESLDHRHREPTVDDCSGSGRRQSLFDAGSGARPTQGGVPRVKRVVSVESVECRGDQVVFNLHVSGHPSYFAEGCLVHNCQYKKTLEYMAQHPNAVKVGLTATPFTKGMGKHWDGMVNVIPTRRLIEEGHLIQPKMYVAKSPDEAELGLTSFGEFSDESAATAGIRIVGDVVAEWVAKTHEFFNGPAKTIVFSPTVEHGRELCAAFQAAGYNFQQVSYLDRSDEERAAKIEEFRRPDSAIHGLVSCGVLTKGFDVPDCLIGISCKPYRKSLSSHMQEIGRIMRPAPGKSIALWLDHAGNLERFALDMFDVWDNGAGELDKAEKRDTEKRERTEATREKVVCPECSGALRGNVCTGCGWEKPARSSITEEEGVLVEFAPQKFSMTPRAGLRADCLKDPRKVWEASLFYCMEHSRKGDQAARKWAYGIFCGVYPGHRPAQGWFDMPVPFNVDMNAYGLIERETRRFRKSKRAA